MQTKRSRIFSYPERPLSVECLSQARRIMRKIKLQLKKVTLRNLGEEALEHIAGDAPPTVEFGCSLHPPYTANRCHGGTVGLCETGGQCKGTNPTVGCWRCKGPVFESRSMVGKRRALQGASPFFINFEASHAR